MDEITRTASDLARERRNAANASAPALITPPLDPTDAVNRAKRGEKVPAAPSDPQNPTGVADVNGKPGTDGGNGEPQTVPLPESLTPQARTALEGAGLTTLALAAAKTDAELDAISGIGDVTIQAIRAAAHAAGLPAPTPAS